MRLNQDLSVKESELEQFQKIIGFKFNDISYLIQALLHGSMFSGNKETMEAFRLINGLKNKDYEKLEYLGDAVLGLIIAEYAYHDSRINKYAKFNDMTLEGVCTRIKEVLASNRNLMPVARKICLSRFVLCDENVAIEGKLADVIEALIGAIYLDGGADDGSNDFKSNGQNSNYSKAKDFVYRFFDIDHALEKISISNPKGRLQEIFHSKGFVNPEYVVLKKEGPDHGGYFTVGLYHEGKMIATGCGNTKRSAEKEAAKAYLRSLDLSQIALERLNTDTVTNSD